jgi:hypothetical protein
MGAFKSQHPHTGGFNLGKDMKKKIKKGWAVLMNGEITDVKLHRSSAVNESREFAAQYPKQTFKAVPCTITY